MALTPAVREGPYHHGDLPSALKAAAVALISEQGIANFSLRETARRVGVSHAAPGFHYGGTKGLLTSIAVDGSEALTHGLTGVAQRQAEPVERLRAMAHNYIDTAAAHRGHFAVMARDELFDAEDRLYVAANDRRYQLFLTALRQIRYHYNSELDVMVAVMLTCSALESLATAAIRELPSPLQLQQLHRRVDQSITLLAAGFLNVPSTTVQVS